MSAPGWPAVLRDGPLVVRPPRARDAAAWSEARIRNEEWLAPWEGRNPASPELTWAERHAPSVFLAVIRDLRREARAGRCLPFVVELDGRLVGQVTVSGVTRGAWHNAHAGYWVDRDIAGRGVAPTALALVADHCFGPVGLHRFAISIRPENAASRRVAEKLGFRQEARYERYLFIDGAWRDHLGFALCRDDVPEGVLARWTAGRAGPVGRA